MNSKILLLPVTMIRHEKPDDSNPGYLSVYLWCWLEKLTHQHESLIYIKLKSHPFVCLSVCPYVCLSVTSITRLGLPVSTHPVPNMKCSSSAYSKFVTASSCVLPFALQSELNAKVQRKLEQHSFENHSRQCSGGRALTVSHWFESRQLLALFFLEIIPFGHTFLLSTFETAVTWHPNHLWRRDSSKIKRRNSNIVVVYQFLLLSVLCSTLKALA